MSVIDTARQVFDLARKIDNIEFIKQVAELQGQVIELVEENRALKARLTTREELTAKRNAYWRGEDGPFCTRCWDADNKLIRLHLRQGFHPRCPACTNMAVDPETPPAPPVARRAVRSRYLDR